MSDRFEREIDEFLAQLGFTGTPQPPPEAAKPAKPASPLARWRQQLPGSPVRLMALSLVVLIVSFLFPGALLRPLVAISVGALLVGYLTWVFEPAPGQSLDRRDWFGRLYYWLYGEK